MHETLLWTVLRKVQPTMKNQWAKAKGSRVSLHGLGIATPANDWKGSQSHHLIISILVLIKLSFCMTTMIVL
jgi:hypothetical protein